MKTIRTSERISLTECKRILNKNGCHYTDDEILAIRDWLYFIGEISVSSIPNKLTQKTDNTNKK